MIIYKQLKIVIKKVQNVSFGLEPNPTDRLSGWGHHLTIRLLLVVSFWSKTTDWLASIAYARETCERLNLWDTSLSLFGALHWISENLACGRRLLVEPCTSCLVWLVHMISLFVCIDWIIFFSSHNFSRLKARFCWRFCITNWYHSFGWQFRVHVVIIFGLLIGVEEVFYRSYTN